MAEAVGLAFGALALLSTFKDCIDLFSTISAARSLGVDYEILNTKLDIEKTLLLQWVDRIKLLDPIHYDRRLDDQRTNKAISSILSSIRLLLSESADLQYRYGLKRVETETAIIPTISGPRMNIFMQEFENLSLRVDATQKAASVKQRFCWVVRDKEKFSNLIQELSGFIGKLNAVTPATREPIDVMTRKDLDKIRNLRQIQLVLEAAKEHEEEVADLAEETITQRCQERILDRFWYRLMDERKNNIIKAHFKTLEWALHPPMPESEWDNLAEWLRSGSGLYWVSGKPGSGKSTLMKYLYERPEVQHILHLWAADRRLIMPYFFFWHLGTPEQQSHAGLSRSLFEIEDAFCRLKSETIKDKFCCFIDGLEEYAGNLATAIGFIDSLVSSDNIKVLVSSGPVPACVQAFSGKPMLRLQDLTRDDIKTYVDDTIGSHAHIQDLMSMEPQSIHRILEDLVDKSSGVFLWVVLACRSLLEGFAAFDYPDELRRRVDELPPELESLFKHMLDKIEPRYQVQAAKLLRICYQRRVNPDAEPFTRLGDQRYDRISEGIYTLGLALVEEHDFDMRPISDLRPLSLAEKRMKCKVLEARMRSRCCGLIEVRRAKGQNERCFCGHVVLPTGRSFRTSFSDASESSTCDGLVDSMVEFMHRSVFEFLSNAEVWELECLHIPDAHFDANAVLSRINLQLAYLCGMELVKDATQINELIREAILCVKAADESSSEAMASRLYSISCATFELIRILCNENDFPGLYPFFFEIQRSIRPGEKAEAQLALILGVELGMTNAVEHMELLGILSSSQKRKLLWHAIERPYSSWLPSFGLDVSPAIIAFLLSRRFGPNVRFTPPQRPQTTPWRSWLLYLQPSFDLRSARLTAEVTELFVKAGADVDVQVPGVALEALIERCLTANTPDLALPLSRDGRAIRSRCDEILRIIAQKRMLQESVEPKNVSLLGQDQGSGPPCETTRSISQKTPKVTRNYTFPKRRKKRPSPIAQSPVSSGVSDPDFPHRLVKRRRGEDDSLRLRFMTKSVKE